jgi:enoyl-CoA hydratase/carnithine racemase
MSYEFILVQREDALTVVTINRAPVCNALNAAAHLELEHAFDVFEHEDDQKVAILTGAGDKAFCAGYDLKQQPTASGLPALPRTGFAGLTSRAGLNKPVIAAVNGLALGGGFETALACDILLASKNAVFAFPEARIGWAALAGGMHRLPREIGLKRAMGLLLTGRRVSAEEGLALGFINELVDSDVLTAARRWARDLLGCGPLAVKATKESVLRGLCLPVHAAIEASWEYPTVKAMLRSEDAVEGVLAFNEKRAPHWRDK